MGGARIAEVLLEEGYTSPYPRKGKKKALSDEVVRNILRRRSAVGEFQPTTRGNKPNGAPIPGVFPQVITETEWREIRGTIEERDTGLGHTKTKKSNLFEKRSFCAICGGLQGVAPTTAKRSLMAQLRRNQASSGAGLATRQGKGMQRQRQDRR